MVKDREVPAPRDSMVTDRTEWGRPGLDPWVGKSPWRREWLSTPVFLLENSGERGAWWATAHGVAKSQTWLTKAQCGRWSCLPGATSGKESAYHWSHRRLRFYLWVRKILGRGNGNPEYSDILARIFPWTKEPGELQTIGLLRVGHDSTHIHRWS